MKGMNKETFIELLSMLEEAIKLDTPTRKHENYANAIGYLKKKVEPLVLTEIMNYTLEKSKMTEEHIDVFLKNPIAKKALDKVAQVYAADKLHPFEGHKKFHYAVRDNLTGEEFNALYNYAKLNANHAFGTKENNLRNWQNYYIWKMSDEGTTGVASAENYEELKRRAKANGPQAWSAFQQAVWGVYAAALTRLHEKGEYDAYMRRQIMGGLFE